MTRILFLCHGNICRSTMAEFVMKELVAQADKSDTIHVESAALHTDEIGSDTYPGTKEVLRRHNIPFAPRQARLVHANEYDAFDYIIGMDGANLRDMKRVFSPDTAHKLSLLRDWTTTPGDIADPWYTRDFDTTYTQVFEGASCLLNHILQNEQ